MIRNKAKLLSMSNMSKISLTSRHSSLTYNGRTYKTVQIGSQCWMAENLNEDSHTKGISLIYDTAFIDMYLSLNEKERKAKKFGRLYDWDAAMDIATKIEGWHLPNENEWTTLITYLGMVGNNKKDGGPRRFDEDRAHNYINRFFCLNDIDLNNDIKFWSQSANDSSNAWCRHIGAEFSYLYCSTSHISSRFLIRLLKN